MTHSTLSRCYQGCSRSRPALQEFSNRRSSKAALSRNVDGYLLDRVRDTLKLVSASKDGTAGEKGRVLSAAAKSRAIDELKRRGREAWGATYYSQMAPLELCKMAGRPREVQYGALIGWVKRLGKPTRPDPACAIEMVAHLLGVPPDDDDLSVAMPSAAAHGISRRSTPRASSQYESFEVNCPSVVYDHRFVVLGELPGNELHPLVLLQPQDGTRLWYPQVARHNPLRAGRAFTCFVRLGNPNGIWHSKKLPLDGKVRVLALQKAWRPDWSRRMNELELGQQLGELGVVAEKEFFVSRTAVDLLAPVLHDRGRFESSPLGFEEPKAEHCVAPLTIAWKGGAAYIEIREGRGDRLLYSGSAASGATLVVRGGRAAPSNATVLFELDEPGEYRLRLYPSVWSFVDPPYEWWINIA